jgi:P4 family phage/plasmid primase-like protien
MASSISQILKKNRVDRSFHSHVSLVSPKGCYQINRKDIEEFWQSYSETIFENPNEVLGIAERPQNYIPVMVDIDIKIHCKEGERIKSVYTNKHVEDIVGIYQSVLRDIIDGITDKHLTCVLLEKKPYSVSSTEYKNGFHLHFPYIFLGKADHEVQLIPRVEKQARDLKVFQDIGFDDSSELIDKSYCRVRWLLYGSRKGKEMDPYLVSKIYDSEMDVISPYEAFREYHLFDTQEKEIEITEENVEFCLPRILSIIPFGRAICETKPNIISPLREMLISRNRGKEEKKEYEKISVQKSLELAKKLLPMLEDFRAEDQREWIEIGWTLHNISEGSSEGLNLWLDFSQRCPEKFSESVCVERWGRMRQNNYTIGTLKRCALIDNPVEYKKLTRENSQKHLQQSLNGSHHDIAKAMFEEYSIQFVCASISSKRWYEFKNHCWKRVEEGIGLRKRIAIDIVPRYLELHKDFLHKYTITEDSGEKAMWDTRCKIVKKLISNLGSAPYKNNVMRECMEVFYVEEFETKLNTNPYLIAFNNGVYDLKNNLFRAGRPEDYISKKMPIDYDEEMREDSEEVMAVEEFLEKVFPDKNLRHYFVDVTSEVFMGGNRRKKVDIWIGENGNNAKSITEMLIEQMLGPYSIKLPTSLLTGKRTQSSSACPELARAGNGVRWAVLQEPSKGDIMNLGIFKELTGNDSIYVRRLYEEGGEITPMFKLVMVANNAPKIPYDDRASWNRLRILPFEATFVSIEDAPDTYEEQLETKTFPMDENFSDKIPNIVKAFAWYLLNHRKNSTGVIVEPEKVKLATAAYRKKNDLYRQFIEEKIVEDKTQHINISTLYNAFKRWFKDSMPNHTVPIREEVKEYLITLWGSMDAGRWSGYRIRGLEDDIKDGTCVMINKEDLVSYNPDGTVANGESPPPM